MTYANSNAESTIIGTPVKRRSSLVSGLAHHTLRNWQIWYLIEWEKMIQFFDLWFWAWQQNIVFRNNIGCFELPFDKSLWFVSCDKVNVSYRKWDAVYSYWTCVLIWRSRLFINHWNFLHLVTKYCRTEYLMFMPSAKIVFPAKCLDRMPILFNLSCLVCPLWTRAPEYITLQLRKLERDIDAYFNTYIAMNQGNAMDYQ